MDLSRLPVPIIRAPPEHVGERARGRRKRGI
jgi:hypothetical protein